MTGGGVVDYLVLEGPGEVVGDEDGVQAGGHGWVDVGAGAVADHPGAVVVEDVVGGEGSVGAFFFLGEDFDCAEVRGEAGAAELVALLGVVALGDEDAAMAFGEGGDGGRDAGEKFDLAVGDGLREADDAVVLLVGEGSVGELLEAVDEGATEALEAVAVAGDGGALDVVEALADLLGGVDAVIEVGDEAGNRTLEVDVVLPERVVGIDQQGLISRTSERLLRVWGGLIWDGHTLIIGSFRVAIVTKVRVECNAWGICPSVGV